MLNRVPSRNTCSQPHITDLFDFFSSAVHIVETKTLTIMQDSIMSLRKHPLYTSGKVISSFELLDDDCIYLILVALCYTDVTRRLKQMWPFSLTCKRLRELCLPLMFKRVLWPNKCMYYIDYDVSKPMLPETLWPYIQCVVIYAL